MLEDIYNYLKLSNMISTSGQPTEEQVSEIAQAGFQVIFNLGLTGTDYALPDEAATVKAHGMEYLHIPVQWQQPTLTDLEAFFSTMEANRERKVFIHCAANMRVSVFMALYRILRLDWSPEKAFQEVQCIWTPDQVWQAFIDQALQAEGKAGSSP